MALLPLVEQGREAGKNPADESAEVAAVYDVIRKLLYLTVDVVVHIHNDRTIGRHITEIWFDPSVKRF